MDRATIERDLDVRQSQVRELGPQLDPDELDGAIDLARRMALERQQADGSWQERGDMGPLTTALSLVCLRHVGQLRADELHDGTRWPAQLSARGRARSSVDHSRPKVICRLLRPAGPRSA